MKKFLLLSIFFGMSWAVSAQLPEFSYSTPLFYKSGTTIQTLQPHNIGGVATETYQVSTIAGNGTIGAIDADGLLSSFNDPSGIVTDNDGNIFVADQYNHRIRKIAKTGVVSTFAGNGQPGFRDGSSANAIFYCPMGLAFDKNGNLLVADSYNHRIRKIAKDGTVSTVAGSGKAGTSDGSAGVACFNFPMGITVDSYGNIFVADYGNCSIRKISTSGEVSTYAGDGFVGYADGASTDASFNYPTGIAIDHSGNLFVVDQGNNRIRKIATDQTVSTIAGDGQSGDTDGVGTLAKFNSPNGITIDAADNLYIADSYNNKIRKITTSGAVSTIVGKNTAGSIDGSAQQATLSSPKGITFNSSGNIIFTDQRSQKVRKVMITPPYSISPSLPSGLSFDVNTGSISGTPEVVNTTFTTTYTVTGTNNYGSYQTNIQFTIYNEAKLPVVTTQEVSDVTFSTATGHGSLKDPGMPSNITSYGICWNTTGTPTIVDQHTDKSGTTTGDFTSAISGLSYNTTYYVRAYATNEIGTTYGDVFSFTTAKCPLTASSVPAITLSKVYSATTDATVDISGVQLSNLLGNDQVILSAKADYDNKNVGKNKTITVIYSLSGANADKYIAPENYISTNGEITPLTLTDIHAIANDKIYDGNQSAVVNDLSVTGVITGDEVKVSLLGAVFSDKNTGSNKQVTISGLSLTGTDAGNYTLPQVPVLHANITPKPLTVDSTLVTTIKKYDGTTTAKIISIGTVSNIVSGDDVKVNALANYNTPEIGTNKVITVTYKLSGTDSQNYIVPDSFKISNAQISDIIILQSLQVTGPDCGASSFDLNYVAQQTQPVQYKIVFNDNALSAGFKNTDFVNLISTAASGTINIEIPDGTNYGNYSGDLIIRNEFGVESNAYSFSFTINVQADKLHTKYNDIILIDNTKNDFVSYQWYKNGELINGATSQYYYDVDGLMGTYYLVVKTKNGSTFNTCPKTITSTAKVDQQVRVYPNPLKINQACTVIIKGIDESELNNTKLSIYSDQGELIYTQRKVEKFNTLNLPLTSGTYIGQCKSANGFSQTFKIIVTE